jgi:hypothetical protein
MSNTSDNVTSQRSRPRFGKIGTALEYSGFGRTKLYQIAGSCPGLLKKFGRRTLVDFEQLDRLLDQLPAAAIKSSPLAPDRE